MKKLDIWASFDEATKTSNRIIACKCIAVIITVTGITAFVALGNLEPGDLKGEA